LASNICSHIHTRIRHILNQFDQPNLAKVNIDLQSHNQHIPNRTKYTNHGEPDPDSDFDDKPRVMGATTQRYLATPLAPKRVCKGPGVLTRYGTEHCQARGLAEPTYQDVSDRRGTLTTFIPSLPTPSYFPIPSKHPHSFHPLVDFKTIFANLLILLPPSSLLSPPLTLTRT
jgi:hypothetical protein